MSIRYIKQAVAVIGIIGGALLCGSASGATSTVRFNSSSGILSVSGACASRFVAIIVRRSADGSIWGSSDAHCSSGTYEASFTVPPSDRNGGAFLVQAIDEGALGGALPASSTTSAAAPPVIFAAPDNATASATIVVDTSSIGVAPYDPSLMDAILNQAFGIVAGAADAVQSFTTVVANSVKAAVVAVGDLFATHITVAPNGSIRIPAGANQLAGENQLGALAMSVFIPNTAVVSSSEILVTPTVPTPVPLAVIAKQDGIGFQVGVSAPQPGPVTFDWTILQTYSAAPPAIAQSFGSGGSSPAPPVVFAGDAAPAPDPATSSPSPATSSATSSMATSSAASDGASSTAPSTDTVPIPDATVPGATTTMSEGTIAPPDATTTVPATPPTADGGSAAPATTTSQ